MLQRTQQSAKSPAMTITPKKTSARKSAAGPGATSEIVCGIDFGTSNSAIAVVRGGETVLVPVEGTHTTIPSAIFFPVKGEPPLYGRAAIAAYTLREPGRLMRSLKSILGSDLIAEQTAVGGRYQSFEAILVGFVKHMKAKAEAHVGTPIDAVVMGRPVHFVDDNDAADARAEAKLGDIARAAGFTSVAYQYEPIAAALSFEHTIETDELVFISDIGGGTADFSIVQVGPARRAKADRASDILANDGVRVGGTNLDMRLSLAAVMPHLGSQAKTVKGRELPRWPFVDLATWHLIHTIATPKNLHVLHQIASDCAEPELFERYRDVIRQQTGHLLAANVEQAKIDLTNDERVSVVCAEALPGIEIEASRAQFETAIAYELERLAGAVAATIAASGRPASAITTVFMTGGSSAVPAVKALMLSLLPGAKLIEGDLFNSVGFGLALDAKRRFAARKAA
jgi:hypothetical chaperone protein